jgi:prepilin-type N-terminal cleavage/methylation domain-containing protein
MPTRTRRHGSGFTLIEMLVVVAILGILGSLILTGVNAARRESQRKQTMATLTIIGAAMARYETDFSDYPPSDGDATGIGGSELLLECLTTDKKEGPYLDPGKDIKTVDSNNNGKMEIADAWNKPIYYWHHRDYGNEEPNKRTYRLISGGLNREFEEGQRGCDDIANFDTEKDYTQRGGRRLSGGGGGGGTTASTGGKLYELIVANGQGTGAYPSGTKVELIATPQAGQRFGQWIVEEGGAKLIDSYSSRTMLTMPEGNVRVVAKFK